MRFEKEIITGKLVKVLNSIYDLSHHREDRNDYLHTKEVEILDLDFAGIVGNRHYGLTKISDGRTKFMYERGSVEIRNNAQWTAISEEELQLVNSNLGVGEEELQPDHIGVNILITGITDFTSIPRGYYLSFSETPEYVNQDPNQVVLIVHGEVNPCIYAGKGAAIGVGKESIANKFPKAANGLRGLRGWVEKPGIFKKGMYLHVLKPTGRT